MSTGTGYGVIRLNIISLCICESMPGKFIISISGMSKVDGSPYYGWKESESVSLCDPMDHSPPGSSVHGVLWARILEWVVIPLSRESFQPRDRTQVSCIAGRFFTIWTTRKVLLWMSLMQSFEGLNETKGGGRSNLLFFPWLTTWVETFHIIYSGYQTNGDPCPIPQNGFKRIRISPKLL